MTKTMLRARTGVLVKRGAQKVARSLGVPSISIVPRLRPEVEEELRSAARDVQAGRDVSGPFATVSSMLKALKA